MVAVDRDSGIKETIRIRQSVSFSMNGKYFVRDARIFKAAQVVCRAYPQVVGKDGHTVLPRQKRAGNPFAATQVQNFHSRAQIQMLA